MKSTSMIVASTLALLASSLSQPTAAQAPTPAAATQFVTEQPPTEWLAHVFIGADVQNASGEDIGDVRDLIFDRTGRISTVVIGVGGFLGIGEKHIAVPFSALTYSVGKDNARVISIAHSKEELKLAPAFKAIEKTRMDTVKDKAVELKDQAAKRIEDMKSAPVKQ